MSRIEEDISQLVKQGSIIDKDSMIEILKV